MASQQLNQMNELYASIKEWLSKPDIDLAAPPASTSAYVTASGSLAAK
jgi:hypothetical protein